MPMIRSPQLTRDECTMAADYLLIAMQTLRELAGGWHVALTASDKLRSFADEASILRQKLLKGV